MDIKGKITSDQILSLRFANSGKIDQLNFKVGAFVNKGALLARQDQSEFQLVLDRALKYYEAVRADFDEKHTKGLNEFDTRKLQAELDVSVKNVEIAKRNLEDTNLYAPISGMIVSADPAAVGLNVTPSAFTITIVDPPTLFFSGLVPEKDLSGVALNQPAVVHLLASDTIYSGVVTTIGLMVDKEGNVPVRIDLMDKSNLRLNLSGSAKL